MQSKKFIFKFLLIFLSAYFLVYFLYFIVNPEQKFDFSITKHKFYLTKDYSKKQYEYLKNNRATLIFGTSQTQLISSDMYGNDVLNMQNLYGETGDIINFLEQLSEKQLKNINNIIYLIDLRAGGAGEDSDLINYKEVFSTPPVLNSKSVSRIFKDINKNIKYKSKKYLLEDGSMWFSINNKFMQKPIRALNHEIPMNYNDKLVRSLAYINKFTQKNSINIIFITPVLPGVHIKSMNFDKLSLFFSSLLKSGIDEIRLFYYIKKYSDLQNDKNQSLAFVDSKHLNQFFVNKWLKEYILTDNKYAISNQEELKLYITNMKEISK